MSTVVEFKGICHSGNIGKAHKLFMSMCASKGKILICLNHMSVPIILNLDVIFIRSY
jgi:pentatricopeptide repeat protein